MSEEKRTMVRPPSGGDSAGRSKKVSLKTSNSKSLSSQQWLKRQLADPFVVRAKAEGWRSRAAFKLIEIDDRFHLIRKGSRVIDLGCAPGGWVQVALQRGAGWVAGVDLLPLDPIPGAHLIEGDFTDEAMGPRLLQALGGPADVVLSDMAPNTTGHKETDHLRITGLVEMAALFALDELRPGGAFVAKTFQGGAVGEILQRLKNGFTEVKHVKPKASRTESSEVYLVALGKKG